MKQHIDQTQWDELTLSEKHFISIWKTRKHYDSTFLSLGECIELLVAVSYNLIYEDSDGRFFNNLLRNEESSVGWDGAELIDILFHEVKLNLRRRFASSGFFSQELTP